MRAKPKLLKGAHVTREEHLAWCKKRALEYVDRGDLQQALTSMMSDMSKHPETRSPMLDQLCVSMMMIGRLSTAQEVRDFINGYN